MCSSLEHGEKALEQAWSTTRGSNRVSINLAIYRNLTEGERHVQEENKLKLPIAAGKKMTESEQEDAEFKAGQLKMVLDAKFSRENDISASSNPVLFNLEEILLTQNPRPIMASSTSARSLRLRK